MFLLDLFHRMGEAVEIVYTLLYLLKFGETPFGKGGGGLVKILVNIWCMLD